ncbi:MAG: dephospho-CoA kinase [Bartonella sp.]|nr:dephospho-CoA kinase [Bartonella sp.]
MIVLGLTGSIGMGKSTTAKFFKQKGIPVYDADETVHQLYQDESVIKRITAIFDDCLTDNHIDRAKISRQIVQEPAKLVSLEKIIHPLVREKENAFVATHRKNGDKLVVLDIPLLFETGGLERVDKIAVVSAPLEIQRQRVLQRDGWTEEKFQAVLTRQIPDSEKRMRADFIIDTSKGLEYAENEVDNIISHLMGEC